MNCQTVLLAVHLDLPLKRKSQNPTSEVTKVFRVGMRTPNTEAVNIRLQFFLAKTQIRIIFFQELIFIWSGSSLNLDIDMWKCQRSISLAYKQCKKCKNIKKAFDTETTWCDGGSQGGPRDPVSWARNSWNPFWLNPCGFGYVLLTHRVLQKWWEVTFENKLYKDGGIWAEVIKKTATYVLGSSLSSRPHSGDALGTSGPGEWNEACQQPREGPCTLILFPLVKATENSASARSWSSLMMGPPTKGTQLSGLGTLGS